MSSRAKKLPVPNKSALPILLIIVVAAVLSLATLLSFSSTSAIIINSSVNEAHSNAQIQASDMSNIVSNKLADVVHNVQVISASPAISGRNVTNIDAILKAAQDSTRDFTTTYSWVDAGGSPVANSNATILAAAQKTAVNVSHQQYFLVPKQTGLVYLSAAVVSNVTGKQYLIVAQPSYYGQQANGNEEVFNGIVAASVSLSSIGQYVNTQLSSHFPGSVGLLDPTGVILYSANASLIGANVFGSRFQASLPSALRQPFDSMINQSLKGITGLQDFSLNGASGTFAYQPVSVIINGANQTYTREAAILFVGLPHVLAADQAAQIALQEFVSTATIAGIGGASAVAALVVLRWNRSLDKTVKERTVELLSANEELKKRDEAQYEFINTAAHELRTPVQPLLGMTENLLQSMKESGTKKVELSEMEAELMARNAKRLEDLTKNILDVTRLESSKVLMKRERFDINDIVKDTIEGFSVHSPANPDMKEVDFLAFDERLTADVDATRVSEVISNLISNALKYTRPGDGRVVVSASREGSEAIIRVKDTGLGIDQDSLPRLFTKFFTKSDSGVGLGLYVSKLVVDAHGGRIWAENNADGPGASFVFTIPLAQERKMDQIASKSNESMETPADDPPR